MVLATVMRSKLKFPVSVCLVRVHYSDEHNHQRAHSRHRGRATRKVSLMPVLTDRLRPNAPLKLTPGTFTAMVAAGACPRCHSAR